VLTAAHVVCGEPSVGVVGVFGDGGIITRNGAPAFRHCSLDPHDVGGWDIAVVRLDTPMLYHELHRVVRVVKDNDPVISDDIYAAGNGGADGITLAWFPRKRGPVWPGCVGFRAIRGHGGVQLPHPGATEPPPDHDALGGTPGRWQDLQECL
jgi:hypothetical protein